MSPLEFFRWIQETQVGTALRESTWVFPIILGFHSLGLSQVSPAFGPEQLEEYRRRAMFPGMVAC